MAKKSGARITIGLICSACKSRNYVTTKNKLNTTSKLALQKFCNKCRKKTEHKETEKLK
ncbi:MAG: 50S ribosomal protein L33 [Armatimonadetes bacterium]|nr:MAG: 50S ribosomal protein L33 [Armatimonadota bacterium]